MGLLMSSYYYYCTSLGKESSKPCIVHLQTQETYTIKENRTTPIAKSKKDIIMDARDHSLSQRFFCYVGVTLELSISGIKNEGN